MTSTKKSPRERLLDAADELFYRHGVRSVGVDRVIDVAGVAKASLYSIYGSKESLVAAYLDRRHEQTMVGLRRAVAGVDAPRDRILAVFDATGAAFAEPGFRGCPFAAASAEADEGGAIEAATTGYRRAVCGLLTELAANAGAVEPEALGRRLHLVYDGAVTAACLDRDPNVAREARDAVEVLLDAAL